MRKNSEIEKDVQQTLAALDNVENLPPDPDFYTHLKGRLREPVPNRPLTEILKPVMFAALLMLNLVTGVRYLTADNTGSGMNSRQTLVNLVAEDLDITATHSDILPF